MTPTEADQRIILSRRTLSSYVQMAAAGVHPEPGTMMLVTDEIALIEGLAEEHPIKAPKLAALVMEWVAYREGLRARMN